MLLKKYCEIIATLYNIDYNKLINQVPNKYQTYKFEKNMRVHYFKL